MVPGFIQMPDIWILIVKSFQAVKLYTYQLILIIPAIEQPPCDHSSKDLT